MRWLRYGLGLLNVSFEDTAFDMKPLKSALFLAAVLVVVQGTLYLLPREGISLFSMHIKNPVPEMVPQGWFTKERRPVDTGIARVALSDMVRKDTVPLLRDSARVKKPVAPLSFTDSLRMSVPRLEMNDTARLALSRLFRMLDSLRSREACMHVLYYGDSQIEGDRITSVVRDSLQKHFGGGGPGLLLPVMTVPYTSTLRIETSGPWTPVSGKRPASLTKFPYGVFGGVSVFDPRRDTTVTGRCRVTLQPFAPAGAKKYNRIGLWLFPAGTEGTISVHAGGKKIGEDTLRRAKALACFQYATDQPFRKIDFLFRFHKPVAVEGIVLQDSVGVCVDNIPLRGRPLMSFSGCDLPLLQEMFRALNVRMIVLQFGLNVAAGEKKGVGYYRKTFTRQLKYLKQYFPEVFVVVVGVTDMAGNGKDTDEKIRMIRDVQRTGALAEGYAFWDAYRAMGGKNAIVRWAGHQPSLARPDYAHLSYQGAQLLGSFFVTSLMQDYKESHHAR